MTAPVFKCRASALHLIMTNGRAVGTMGQTGYTYLEKWVASQFYGKEQFLHTDAVMKGSMMEEQAIRVLSEFLRHDIKKNEQFFEDEHFTGTPDIIDPCLIDIKCSESHLSHPLFDQRPDPKYLWQMQCYMELTGHYSAELQHVLVNAPAYQIDRSAWNEAKKLGMDEVEEDVFERVCKSMTYDDVPIDRRIKTFVIEYDPVLITKARRRVEECRLYVEQLWNQISSEYGQ